VDHFEDQFFNGKVTNPWASLSKKRPSFLIPKPAQEADFLHPQQQAEESIYTDDPVRVYLREMGAVPLLTREG
jgi:RNA polymerase primary sigma factor